MESGRAGRLFCVENVVRSASSHAAYRVARRQALAFQADRDLAMAASSRGAEDGGYAT